ncbi:MAG: glycine cleavage system aminomethyltransferase GcvT [Rhodobacteraceae bacterium]|nr:glycine cleavage system aminomethyltransferase GcvT [Paracoccaceae bacterium]
MSDLKTTSLNALHLELGARMVPFAGYEMPVQYPMGVLGEHLHCRASAGLFDVSHMGQVRLAAKSGDLSGVALALETLVPVDVLGLAEGRQRYGFFTNKDGGILDDLMIANRGDHLLLVVNAGCKDADLSHMQNGLSGVSDPEMINGRSLLALQGPKSETALARLVPDVAGMRFMDVRTLDWQGVDLWISRSGYTGEDGFEVSVPDTDAETLARELLAMAEVAPIGLGARDSLRLEAGLCLYGHDIDETTSPIEAGLGWAIQKVRRTGGARAGGYPGDAQIMGEIDEGTARKRVGLLPEGRAPMRQGTPLFADATSPAAIGSITSGGFGPSVERPISMGYVDRAHAETGTKLFAELRGKRLPVTVAALPFTKANFKH